MVKIILLVNHKANRYQRNSHCKYRNTFQRTSERFDCETVGRDKNADNHRNKVSRHPDYGSPEISDLGNITKYIWYRQQLKLCHFCFQENSCNRMTAFVQKRINQNSCQKRNKDKHCRIETILFQIHTSLQICKDICLQGVFYVPGAAFDSDTFVFYYANN